MQMTPRSTIITDKSQIPLVEDIRGSLETTKLEKLKWPATPQNREQTCVDRVHTDTRMTNR